MSEIKQILFPVDFSEGSEEAFGYAKSLAQKYGAKLDIIHVIHEMADMTGFYVPHISFDVIEKEMEEAARENMTRFCSENLKGMDYDIHIKKGIPFSEIIKAAKELDSDLIVMGTHGRTGIDHILFGSTAEKVVRMSLIPVLTVRQKGKAFTMP